MSLDIPADASQGVWWLDVERGGRHVVVEWKDAARGFGVSLVTEESGLGEPADEWFASVEDAATRVTALLAARPPERSHVAG